MKFAFLLLTICLATIANAGVEIPTGMDNDDREAAVRILGFGTSSKILSDPYPLGGYHGLEIGLTIENLPAEDLGQLGNTVANPQKDVTYPKISIGKGLFEHVDAFVNFIPYTQKLDQTQYGGIIRWGLYQAKYLPITISGSLNFNNANLNNQISTRTVGVDIVGGINADLAALYVGVGPIQSRGRFIGGASGVTDTGATEVATVNGIHTMLGANVRFATMFVAMQIDKYENTTYSGKLGVRF